MASGHNRVLVTGGVVLLSVILIVLLLESLCVIPGLRRCRAVDLSVNKRGVPKLRAWSQIQEMDQLTLNLSHSFQMNSWYKYAQFLARGRHSSECYVCTKLPVTASHLPLRVKPFERKLSFCFLQYSSRGYIKQPAKCEARRYELTQSDPVVVLSQYVEWTPGEQFPICVHRVHHQDSHQVVVGSLPTESCQAVYHPGNIHVGVPGVNGTFPVEDLAWLCGHAVLLSLPANWTGLCAPVAVTDDSFMA